MKFIIYRIVTQYKIICFQVIPLKLSLKRDFIRRFTLRFARAIIKQEVMLQYHHSLVSVCCNLENTGNIKNRLHYRASLTINHQKLNPLTHSNAIARTIGVWLTTKYTNRTGDWSQQLSTLLALIDWLVFPGYSKGHR